WEKYDQGIWMLEDLYAVYHKAYPDMIEETNIVLQNWLQLMEPMQESIAFMKQVKDAGYGVYILSNISQDSAD
ncbi:HAD family phosphatase, partial [Anaerostipes caccae]|nr:HAD family phosphatase [Anaerostipes caccae]